MSSTVSSLWNKDLFSRQKRERRSRSKDREAAEQSSRLTARYLVATSFFSLLSWLFCSSSSRTLERSRSLCSMALLSSSLSLIPACCVWMSCCNDRDPVCNIHTHTHTQKHTRPDTHTCTYRKPDISAWLAGWPDLWLSLSLLFTFVCLPALRSPLSPPCTSGQHTHQHSVKEL